MSTTVFSECDPLYFITAHVFPNYHLYSFYFNNFIGYKVLLVKHFVQLPTLTKNANINVEKSKERKSCFKNQELDMSTCKGKNMQLLVTKNRKKE